MSRRHLALNILSLTAIYSRIPAASILAFSRTVASIRSSSTHRIAPFTSQLQPSLGHSFPRQSNRVQYPTCHSSQMHMEYRTAPSELLADRLEKPLLDDRSYRVIRLPNQLEALIIHDPETDKASAAVDVKAGSLSDSIELPGMAHAVEHMLFLGNEKYPSENDYTQYLAQYAGSHNAFTAQTSTNYFFEMSVGDDKKKEAGETTTDPFHGALDRFAQFFIKPLFLEDSLDRELRAVDSENKKNLQSDVWRLQQLKRSLSNPAHPNSKFSTGNLKTLRDDPIARGMEIRKEFISFYDQQYSANRMKLVILGRESLDQLQEWAEELFSAVPNKDLKPNSWDVPLLTEKELLTEVFAKPVAELRQMDIIFPYPDEEDLWESAPGRYIAHLIGHEGPGSILAHIKAKGWANGLSAGIHSICRGSTQFEICISLTPEGLKNYQEVVKTIFEYLSILHEAPPQEWMFNETRDLSEVDFRFQQKRSASKTASAMAGVMQRPIAREQLLNGLITIRKFEPEAITRGIKALNTDNFRLVITSKEMMPGEVLREKWYGTEYSIRKISDDFMSQLKKAASSTPDTRSKVLHFPAVNEFVPTRLEVEKKEVTTPASRPTLVRRDERAWLWYKKDDRFWVPRATYSLTMRNPICGTGARNVMMTSIYTNLVSDALSEYSYDAELAGLDYSFHGSMKSLSCTISGYNDKMSVLLEKVLNTARNLEIKNDRFDIIKEQFERGLRNKGFSAPYNQIQEYSRWLMSDVMFIADQYLEELPSITADDIRAFQPLLFSQLHIEALAHGNLYLEDALKMTDLAEKILQARTLPPGQWPTTRAYILPEGSNFIYSRELPDPANINHAIEYLMQVGDCTDGPRRAQVQLLDQMMREPSFNQLRTKEQLGYVVFSFASRSATRLSFNFIIQSERKPEYLESRIDTFLRTFKKDLQEMDAEKFEGHRRSVINSFLEKLKNMDKETSRFQAHLANERYSFEQHLEDAKELEKVTKEDMIEFFARYIDPESQYRAKQSVYLRARSTPEDVTGSVSAEDQQQAFSSMLSQFLTAIGATQDPDKIQARFEKVDIRRGDQESILGALRSYLSTDAGLAQENVTAAMEQATGMIGQMLSQLGIKTATVGGAEEEVAPASAIAPVVVEDVHAFKRTLQLSAGPTPVRELSEYEKEPVAKL